MVGVSLATLAYKQELPRDSKSPGEDAFLGVEAIFGLVENHGLGPINDAGGDFLIPMRGKAMHENRV